MSMPSLTRHKLNLNSLLLYGVVTYFYVAQCHSMECCRGSVAQRQQLVNLNKKPWVGLRACRGHQCCIGMLLQSAFVRAASCKGFKTAGTKPLRSRPCPQARISHRPAECSAANVLREAPEVGPGNCNQQVLCPADLHLCSTGFG